MDGQVIGVNTAIYTQSAGYQGIGFAMPSNTVVQIYNDLIGPEHKVVRGSIGISFQPGSVRRRRPRLRLQERRAGQQRSAKGGPADKAGIKAGDIITSIDGKPIKDGDDLVNIITARHPGIHRQARLSAQRPAADRDRGIADRTKTVGALTGQNNAPNENGPEAKNSPVRTSSASRR